MRRRGSLSARLRAEVQSSTTLWSATVQDGDSPLPGYPCDVKPGVFFYKYLQPYEPKTGAGSSARRLRVNLPLTVVAERPNGTEAMLWLETDASGCVAKQEKAPVWRRKLYTDLLEQATVSSRDGTRYTREVVLAVRTTPRWRPRQAGVCTSTTANSSSSASSSGAAATASVGRSTVVLTTETFDHVVNVPSDLPVSVQRFVRSRGLQASVYRVYWDESEGKSYAVNLLNGLRFADAPVGSSDAPPSSSATSATSAPTVPVSIPPASVLSEQALARAAALAEFLCVQMSTDAKAVAKLTKIRGKPVSEPIETAKRIVEHAQLHLPGVRFRVMTLEFLRDTNGTWWLLSVVDFRASLVGLEGVDEDALDVDPVAKASAVHLPDLQRTRQLCRPRNLPVTGTSVTGNAVGVDGLMTRSCFLCGSLCELSAGLKREVLALMKGDPSMSRSSDDTREMLNSIADYRMTLKMALETVYLLRQRGIVLSTWEAALQAVRRSPVQGVVEFAVCLLCYRIFKHQQSLQKISHELHAAVGSPSSSSMSSPSRQDSSIVVSNSKNATMTLTSGLIAPLVGLGAAGSAASTINTFTAGSVSPDLYEVRPAMPATAIGAAAGNSESVSLSTSASKRALGISAMLDRISNFQREVFPAPLARHRAHTVDDQHSQYEFAIVDGGAVDPSSTQMRVVFFFHELQDGGPELTPTDFYLEYQLGQCFYRIYLEGSKCHTPNRWQLCEARVHYTLATVEDFTEYCADKKLLIKMKRRASTTNDNGCEARVDGDDDEFFGFSVLSFKPLITAAKWFGNSLLPESRTDYLLELHTTRYGLLTLKLTVGLLVDPVPLRNVRDVVCSRAFLEERAPVGSVYWPPPSLCLCGLVIPRDWIGALMPSEYISVLPMRARAHSSNGNSGAGRRGAGVSFGPGTKQQSPTRPHNQSSSVPVIETPSDGTQQPYSVLEDGPGPSAGAPPSSMASHAALSRACMLSKTLVMRMVDDASVSAFPTSLLAVLLRQTRFQSASEVERLAKSTDEASARGWSEPATFHFTRKLSVDQLVSLTRAPLRSTLALLGELLLVLQRNRFIPNSVNVAALEHLIEPFWLQRGVISTAGSSGEGWQVVPRTSGHLPEHRAVWNRAVRRCDAARDATTGSEVQADTMAFSPSRGTLSPSKNGTTTGISVASSPANRQLTRLETLDSTFRYESQTLTLCDLFEEMEALDNGYLDIAELRSLRKVHENSVDDPEAWTGLPRALELVGTRECLTPDEIVCIAQQIDEQQHRTAVTTLRSMLESGPMVDALERFDQQGYGNLSFDDFRRLANDALQADRDTFRAFRKEPTTTGFCIRHGAAEVFAVDTICVQCTQQFVIQPLVSETEEISESNTIHTQAIDSKTGGDATNGSKQEPLAMPIALDRSESPSPGDHGPLSESSPPQQREVALRRRQTIAGSCSSESLERPPAVDTELHATLERLQAAEWHVRHRQESMGKASFRQLIADHSAQAAARRPSTRTSSMCSNNQGESTALSRCSSAISVHASVVADLPRPSALAMQSIDGDTLEPRKKSKKPTARKKRKGKSAKSGAPSSFTKTSAPPLSSLLRMELGTADAAGRSGGAGAKGSRLQAARSTDLLIEKVARTEAKRKQLDQLVLAELDVVKQRLARLLTER